MLMGGCKNRSGISCPGFSVLRFRREFLSRMRVPKTVLSDGRKEIERRYRATLKSKPEAENGKNAEVGTRFLYLRFIPASNEPSGCLQTFGDCREGQKPRCSAALQV